MKSPFVPAFSLLTGTKPLYTEFQFTHEIREMTQCIHFLSQINCFVGVNNSGKSRLIRAMFNATKKDATQATNTTGQTSVLDAIKLLRLRDDDFKRDEDLAFIAYFGELLDKKFYIFENYDKVYAHIEELRKVIENRPLMEKWGDIVFKKLDYQKEKDRIDFIKKLEEYLETYKSDYDNLSQKKANFQPKLPNWTNISWTGKRVFFASTLEEERKQLEQDIRNIGIPINNYTQEKSYLLSELRTLPIEQQRVEKLQKQLEDISPSKSDLLLKIQKNIDIARNRIEEIKQYNSKITSIDEKIYEKYKKRLDLQVAYLEKEIAENKKDYTKIFSEDVKEEINSLILYIIESLGKVRLSLPRLYIPILRGTRPLVENKDDFYAQRTEKDYKINPKEMFTGLTLYKEVQNHLLGDYEKRLIIKAYEDFLSKSFFNNQPISLVPHIDSDVVHIRIGNAERPIYELGDGIQALIVLTFPLFIRKNEAWAIFIEEPEAHLHPKWQRFFFDTIKQHFPKHQFFVTTHSNIFISYPDVSNYRVWQEKNFTKVEYIHKKESDLLAELGYKASDLLNANYIIWVEGASDKIYVQQFIQAYDSELKEGVDYSIMFYGGCSNLTGHISVNHDSDKYKINILNLNPNCGFILDGDLSKGEKLSINQKDKYDFQNACNEAGVFCWVTKHRETENHIPEDVWKQAAVLYAQNIPNQKAKSLTIDNVEICPKKDVGTIDYRYADLIPKNKDGTVVYTDKDKGIKINVNDKVMMAKHVVSIFPKNQSDLKKDTELYDKIESLVTAIKKANLADLQPL